MIYELATIENLQAVYDVVQHSIKTVYPKYYPVEVVNFFCEHHSKDAILKDIKNGDVSVLKLEGKIIATGCFIENHITRVYVLPEYQKKGYGTFIMKNIEAQIAKKYDKAYLDASLSAAALYEKLGFSSVKHEKCPVENGVVLAYEIMEKELHKVSTDICYNGRKFVPKMNSLECNIREWKISDADNLAEILNNKKILNNLRDGLPYPYTRKDAEEYITTMLSSDKTKTFAFAITVNDQVIGSIGVFRCENIHFRTAEMGYYIGEPYWGKGLGTSAVKQVCSYIFQHTDIIRIFAEPFAYNTASCRVLEKAGFQFEGVLRSNAIKSGQILDMRMYSKIKE